MDAVIFLEILDARGSVESRQALTLPVRIGRSYHNDVILDDRFVDPEHATIAYNDDSDLVFTDLGTTNGTWLLQDNHPAERVVLRSGDRLRLGRTTLRVCTADHPVPPTAVEPVGFGHVLLRRPAWSWAIIALGMLLAGLWEGIANAQPKPALSGLGLAIGVFTMLAVWAGGWAFATRIVGKRFRFHRHLLLATVVSISLAIWFEVSAYGSFITGGRLWSDADGLAGIAAMTLALFGHLSILGVRSSKRRWTAAASATVALAILGYAVNAVLEDTFISEVQITQPVKPVSVEWLVTTNLDEFFVDAAVVKTMVDDLASRNGPRVR